MIVRYIIQKRSLSLLQMFFLTSIIVCATSSHFAHASTSPGKTTTMQSTRCIDVQGLKTDETLLVFVHGLYGDALQTWGNFPYFLQVELASRGLSDYKTCVYDYISNKVKSSPTIPTVAGDLYNILDKHRQAKEFILIGHSMGGIVTKDFILQQLRQGRSADLRVNQLVLIAVPNNGSEAASIVRYLPFLDHNTIADITPNSTFIRSQVRDWTNRVTGQISTLTKQDKKKIRVDAIYAEYDEYVTSDSAADRFFYRLKARSDKNCQQDEYAAEIVYTHTSIVKPACPKDFVVQAVTDRIASYLKYRIKALFTELPREDQQVYLKAKDYIKQGKFRDAIPILKTLTTKYDNSHHFLHYDYGTSLLQDNQFEAAIGALSLATKMGPQDHSSHFNLGLAYFSDGKLLDKAEEEFNTARAIYREHSRVNFMLGSIARDKAKKLQNAHRTEEAARYWDEAKAFYRHIIDKRLDAFEYAHYFLARILLKKRPTQEDYLSDAITEIKLALAGAKKRELGHPDRFKNMLRGICEEVVEVGHPLHQLKASPTFQTIIRQFQSYYEARQCLQET